MSLQDRERCHQVPQEDTQRLECPGEKTWQLEERAQNLSLAGFSRMPQGHLWSPVAHP